MWGAAWFGKAFWGGSWWGPSGQVEPVGPSIVVRGKRESDSLVSLRVSDRLLHSRMPTADVVGERIES